MASTTPEADPDKRHSRNRSTSRGRNPPSRPTTPLRPISRTSLHDSGRRASGRDSATPLDALEPAFAELSDSMADLEANFMHLQVLHESLARFSENFASFLYGMNMNAFCVDFPEVNAPSQLQPAKGACACAHVVCRRRYPTPSSEPARRSRPKKPSVAL